MNGASVGGVVVVGAGMAGLLSAAAASQAGHRVTVLERDVLEVGDQAEGDQAEGDRAERDRGDGDRVDGHRTEHGARAALPRRGVPQGHHTHVLLHAGLTAMEELLPGLRREVVEAGGVPFDTGDLAWLSPQGWLSTGRPAYEVLGVTRPLVEAVVRRRVCSLPGVRLRSGVRVTGVRPGPAGGWSVALADGTDVAADVVLDASGRGSRLGSWLAALGIGPAAATVVDPGVGYASRLYRLPANALKGFAGVVVQPGPDRPVGGSALPVENGRWIFAAQGFGAGRPGRDAASMRALFERLPDPVLADLMNAGEPAGDVHTYRRAGNVRHHYDRLVDWPDGLLPVGDSLCAFNPVYGQGISVAARQALVLRDALAAAAGREPGAPGRAVLRRLQRVADLPWSLSTGADRGFPAALDGRQRPPERLLGWWAARVGDLSTHGNDHAQHALSRLYHLVGSPAELLAPALVLAVARGQLAGLPPAVPRPSFPLSPVPASTSMPEPGTPAR